MSQEAQDDNAVITGEEAASRLEAAGDKTGDTGASPAAEVERKASSEGVPANLSEFFKAGYRPNTRSRWGKSYIRLRQTAKPFKEHAIGEFDAKVWDDLQMAYNEFLKTGEAPKMGAASKALGEKEVKGRSRGGLLSASLQAPASLASRIGVDTTTLLYYEWATQHGYKKSLGEFLNEVTKTYFLKEGVEVVVALKEAE